MRSISSEVEVVGQSQRCVLIIDFGVIPMHSEETLPLMWSGLFFTATMTDL